jgi:signal transduction histidine kinase
MKTTEGVTGGKTASPEGPRPDLGAIAVFYVPLHLFLDWVSFIHELPPLNITPWNPPSGLMMGALIAFGPRVAPVAWVALVAGDVLIRGLPVDLWAALLSNAVIAGFYALAAWAMRGRLGLSPGLERLRDIVALIGGATLAAAVVGAAYISIFMALGLFPWSSFPPVMARYWVGEVIGIMVLTPLALVCLRVRSRRIPPRLMAEAAVQAAAIALALWADFGPLSSDQYEYFYLLFLPAVWIATRHGLPGAALAALVTQSGLILAIQMAGIETGRMTHFQLLMLALTITSLLLGAVVSERRRVEAWVRERQADFAHASRLTEAGEMTAALAHEINQPLAATMSYARAARKIALRDGASSQLAEILDKTVAQAERADRVVRSLRDFVRKGESTAQPVEVAALVAEAVALAAPVTSQHGATVVVDLPAALPRVMGDPIQLQQVLMNLLRNAAEAMSGTEQGRIVVTAGTGLPGFVAFSVRDSGPGLAEVVARNLFVPFVTTKPTGMGLGLSIARSIIEAHGGNLSAARRPEGGTDFQFTVPVEPPHEADRTECP